MTIHQADWRHNPAKFSVFQSETIEEMYLGLVTRLMIQPDYETAPRGQITRELINVTAILTGPPKDSIIANPSRNLNRRYLCGELMWYLRGDDSLKIIGHYSKFWNQCSDDGFTVRSAYGKRIFFDTKNIDYVVKLLTRDPDTRKAVIPIYDKSDQFASKDNPCTMYMQFIIRDGLLSMHVYMRSNDIWFGFPYDVPFFRLVHEIVWRKVLHATKVQDKSPEIGPYYHHVGSLHAYERNFASLDKVLGWRLGEIPKHHRPALHYDDIATWFKQALNLEHTIRNGWKYDPEYMPRTLFQRWLIDGIVE